MTLQVCLERSCYDNTSQCSTSSQVKKAYMMMSSVAEKKCGESKGSTAGLLERLREEGEGELSENPS